MKMKKNYYIMGTFLRVNTGTRIRQWPILFRLNHCCQSCSGLATTPAPQILLSEVPTFPEYRQPLTIPEQMTIFLVP